LEPLTTYFSDSSIATANLHIAFEFNKAQSTTLCNYFGKEYGEYVASPQTKFQPEFEPVALTSFPGYLGAKDGDIQFLSFAGAYPEFYAPGNVQVCPGGQIASIYRDAKCFAFNGTNYCDSKNVMRMAKFPNPETEIVGKTHAQLVMELREQTDFKPLNFC
jgi:hypothetical protein